MTQHKYKVLDENMRSRPNGGSPGFHYPLGKWTPPVADPRVCVRGYHTLDVGHVLDYAFVGGLVVRFLRRGCGEPYVGKQANSSVKAVEIVGKVTKRALLLTAADAAEIALPRYKEYDPDDLTLEVAIHTLRAYALGGTNAAKRRAAHNAVKAVLTDTSLTRSNVYDVVCAVSNATDPGMDAADAAAYAVDNTVYTTADGSYHEDEAVRHHLGTCLFDHIRDEQ